MATSDEADDPYAVRVSTPRLLAIALTATVLGAPALAAAPAAEAALPAVMITKVSFDSPGRDTGSNASLKSEWVLLKNTTGTKRTLTGWTLRDRSQHIYRFPTFTLSPGASVFVHSGQGTATATHRYYNKTWYVWNNTGDTAYLRDSTGVLKDSCAWTTKNHASVTC